MWMAFVHPYPNWRCNHSSINWILRNNQYNLQLNLVFMDTEIIHHENGLLATSVYREKTHTDNYLCFDSHHPFAHKLAVVHTLFSRARSVCSTREGRIKKKIIFRSS